MTSLDRHKKEADTQHVLATASNKRNEHIDAIYRERILPRMAMLYQHLKQMCDEQNQSDVPVRANYIIEGFGRLENLRQTDYRVEADSLIETNQIRCEFTCAASGELGVYIEGKRSVDLFTEIFRVNELQYSVNEVKDDSGLVTGARLALTRSVPVAFTFKVDPANLMINLQMSNFESLGQASTQLSSESINENFVKNLLEYIKRRNKGFFNLDLPEIERRRIRARVMYEQQQRQAELEAANKHGQDKEPGKKSFFNRLIGR